ncbi:hypothetical protein [Caudoviricetes sp.]|nr:hypothetical protein [Caudoviricetes sp.]UOF81090.1 hypothetical protein [Caudoviricetes sp.]UOF82229.1 hypothetical protein [Caudoviricetes sp.]UOF82435.1 hypothetical protein [Caudoviricetes sp.]UOF82634.1 hypothetical protein [Caudoviricetes sp.]
MTQPTTVPDFSKHSITPDVSGYAPALIPASVTYTTKKPDAQYSQRAKDLTPGQTVRRTVGLDAMAPTLTLEPTLPNDLLPVSHLFNMLWRADDGLLVDEIGVHFTDAHGREHSKWWACDKAKPANPKPVNPKAALALYGELVFPYLREVYADILTAQLVTADAD